ncbi:universal stress protein [Candidatus Leptofilum sp.]|uniref:universal stress protein n=1 Tax=Candidatus Leptofilum sp. TaxID=3241576 RepID=UPI003B5AE38D
MFTHLLLPLDGSKLAEAALPIATAVAEKFDSKITLVSAVHLPYYVGDGLDFAEVYGAISHNMEDEAKAYLRNAQKALLALGLHVNIEIIIGQSPAEAILLAVEKVAADVIVMSTHGRGGVMRWVFGSVADKVLRNARIPVLLVRNPQDDEPAFNVELPAIEDLEDIRAQNEPTG